MPSSASHSDRRISAQRYRFNSISETHSASMNSIRILVANEPRAYRDVMAAAFQILCPQHEVISIVPEELDTAVARLDPHLVLCSCGCRGAQAQLNPVMW